MVEGDDHSSASAPSGKDRLGLAHLMLWAAGSAVALAMLRFWIPREVLQGLPNIQLAILALGSVGTGIELGGLMLLAARRYRGVPFPVHPGEWLLAAEGIRTALHAALMLAIRLASGTVGTLSGMGNIAISPIGAFVYWYVARRVSEPARWRWFFWCLVVISCVRLVSVCLPFPFWLFHSGGLDFLVAVVWAQLDPLISSVMLLFVIYGDLVRFNAKPWTHWAGVVAYLWGGMTSLIWVAIYAWETMKQ